MSKNSKTVLISWAVLVLIVVLIVLILLCRIRPVVTEYALSNIEGNLQKVANEAIISSFESSDITYDKISVITRDTNNNFKGVEINTPYVNSLKSRLANSISDKISNDCYMTVSVPLGTVISGDCFYGVGPEINFTVQYFEGVKVDIESKFTSCGINEILHQIILNVRLSGQIVAIGRKSGFSVNTKSVIAETIISGSIPNTFADVSKK